MYKEKICSVCGMKMEMLNPTLYMCKCGNREVDGRASNDHNEVEYEKWTGWDQPSIREGRLPPSVYNKVKASRRKRTSIRGG